MNKILKAELEKLIKLGEKGVDGRDIADQIKRLIKNEGQDHSEVTFGTRVMNFGWYENHMGRKCEKHTLSFSLPVGEDYSLVVLEDDGRWTARVEIGDMHISSLTELSSAETALDNLVSMGGHFATALLHLREQAKL